MLSKKWNTFREGLGTKSAVQLRSRSCRSPSSVLATFPVGCLWVSSVRASSFSVRFWNICSAGWRRLAAEMSWAGMHADECCRCLLAFCFWINSRRILMRAPRINEVYSCFRHFGMCVLYALLGNSHSSAACVTIRRHYGMMDGFGGIQFGQQLDGFRPPRSLLPDTAACANPPASCLWGFGPHGVFFQFLHRSMSLESFQASYSYL